MSPRPRYKFVVCYPSSKIEVKAFPTLKAARAFMETITSAPIDYFPWDTVFLPMVKKISIEKYNQRRAIA